MKQGHLNSIQLKMKNNRGPQMWQRLSLQVVFEIQLQALSTNGLHKEPCTYIVKRHTKGSDTARTVRSLELLN